jgi:hypothetical protein
MGLAAAIPAAFFYNYFTSRIKVLSSMMDDFALEFLNIVERHVTLATTMQAGGPETNGGAAGAAAP